MLTTRAIKNLVKIQGKATVALDANQWGELKAAGYKIRYDCCNTFTVRGA